MAAAVAVWLGTAVMGAAPANAAMTCQTDSGAGPNFYDGPKSSNFYDSYFRDSHELGPSVLDSHVPQGLAVWPNFYGKGKNLLVYTAYSENDGNAYIQGINPADGKRTKIAEIYPSHVGGIAIHGKFAYVSGNRNPDTGKATIRRYRLSELKNALVGSGNYIKWVGNAQDVHSASFMAVYGDTLYAGRFDKDSRNSMYAYGFRSDGSLYRKGNAIEVPMKTQGLFVTGSKFVFTTSWTRNDRGNLYVTDKGTGSLEKRHAWCFRTPSMIEGVTGTGGYVYVMFESGASKYADSWVDKPRNIITNLHRIPASTLF